MTDLERQIEELANKQAALRAQKAREEAEKKAREAFEWNSKVKLVRFLEQYLDAKIKLGKMTSSDFWDVFKQYKKVYQDMDDQLAFFVATVIKTIAHPWYGVECQTKFIGNGGLLYKGQSYTDPKALYEAVFESILGDSANDPFGTDVWFYELLSVHFEDPTALPAYATNKSLTKERVLPLCRKAVALEANPELPDINDLTSDDMFYIQELLGMGV
jgi:hypothetical protein